MKISNLILKRTAFALTEILVTSAAASILLAALSTGVMTMRRSLVVNMGTAESESDMLRMADYLTKDLRQAETISTSSDADGNSVLTLTLPACYESDDPSNAGYKNLRDATIAGENVVYGTGTPSTVEYKLVDGDIRRTQSGVAVAVIDDADSFTLNLVDDRSKSEVAFTASFTPQYSPFFAAKTHAVDGLVRTRNPRKD